MCIRDRAYRQVGDAITPALCHMVEQALREHAATATIAVSDLVEVTQAVFDFRVLAAMASGRQADIDRMTNQLTMMVLTFVHPM